MIWRICRRGWAASSSATGAMASAVTAQDLKAAGAMAALLRDALAPNLVQTLEGSPALVHGGPFANIAHGCNSVIATRLGLKLADVVVTEAGFGADLGGEKFLDIKCRSAGVGAVLLRGGWRRVRALKMHGGVARADLGREDLAALERGLPNLVRHVENMAKFGLPVVVALNRFGTDTEAEFAAVQAAMAAHGVEAVICDHWAQGSAGAADLARAVLDRLGQARFAPLYPDAMGLADKLRCVAREVLPRRRYRPAAPPWPGGWRRSRRRASATCRSASPRRNTASARTRRCWARRRASPCRCVKCGCRPVPGSWWRCAATIMTMPGLPRRPAAEGVGPGCERGGWRGCFSWGLKKEGQGSALGPAKGRGPLETNIFLAASAATKWLPI